MDLICQRKSYGEIKVSGCALWETQLCACLSLPLSYSLPPFIHFRKHWSPCVCGSSENFACIISPCNNHSRKSHCCGFALSNLCIRFNFLFYNEHVEKYMSMQILLEKGLPLIPQHWLLFNTLPLLVDSFENRDQFIILKYLVWIKSWCITIIQPFPSKYTWCNSG